MAKNLILDPILACLAQIWAPKFLNGFEVYYMLGIIASFHCMQRQGKLMNQTWENDEIPSFKPNFGPFWLKFGPPKIFCGFYFY